MKYYLIANGKKASTVFNSFAEVVTQIKKGLRRVGLGSHPFIEELDGMLARTPNRRAGFTEELPGLTIQVVVDR